MTNMTRNLKSAALAIAGVLLLPSCTANCDVSKTPVIPTVSPKKPIGGGKASWYSVRTNLGTRTASGQRLSDNDATAAHKTLPMGTRVRVTNLANGKAEIVTITDRGPYIAGRVIDVTIGVARRLDFYSRGVIPVRLEIVDKI